MSGGHVLDGTPRQVHVELVVAKRQPRAGRHHRATEDRILHVDVHVHAVQVARLLECGTELATRPADVEQDLTFQFDELLYLDEEDIGEVTPHICIIIAWYRRMV